MLFFKRKSSKILLSGEHAPPVRPDEQQAVERLFSSVHQVDGYLEGQLLVSTPNIEASCFHKSVIFLFAHNDEGAMGMIINQPMERVDYASLLEEEAESELAESTHIDVQFGGPIDRIRGFVLHSNDYRSDDAVYQDDKFGVSAHATILKDMLHQRGPKQHLLAVGYAGWAPGQLEREIEENSWITVPATTELVFEMDNDMKWAMAARSLGIDMHFLSRQVGHA